MQAGDLHGIRDWGLKYPLPITQSLVPSPQSPVPRHQLWRNTKG
ncbi:hypothetical protein GXM_04106 [Nostoc sphaeroides CCNUC1]|uniref:Uncharacterized protein n=1 Tax=Nostoc sphaeroides CCNUC1 TaxID=2653204 RepID=A0A5P8W1M4_9NOSO|nr:hypothetical protein GXM_04106 [Nostoc sphaeroides CCNUC1]